jgi:hypothetical protein
MPLAIQSGMTFGAWTVIRPSECRPHHWDCACECGVTRPVAGRSLARGISNSCGCKQSRRGPLPKHGELRRSPAYNTWMLMVQRCFNPKCRAFKYYGARGITVCERWRQFEGFYADMGARPEDSTLDRIDVNGNYEPGNCRWATRLQQANNTRSNRPLTFDGRTQNMAEWARERGIRRDVIFYRLKRGWTEEEAISIPLLSGRPRDDRRGTT